jgi:Inner membrane component of T3SS, cytoplasmic domain
MKLFYIFGWTITGLLVGTSVGVFEVLASVVQQQNYSGSVKKLVKGLIGGTAGGLLGGVLSLVLNLGFEVLFSSKEQSSLWSPSAWGFVALGMCIGLLIGLAQIILMEAWVKVETGKRAGREMILTRERTTIGRAESCDIGLFGDNQIEKLHAIILQAGNRYYVEDEHTPTGTYVNEAPVQGRVVLKSGDRIRVGASVLCFRERAKH